METLKKMLCAIYPTAYGYGYVYMENPRTLIDYGSVRVSPINNRRMLKRIKKTFSFIKPEVVILLNPEGLSSRTGYRIRKLVDRIKELCTEEKMNVYFISRDQIRDVFEQFGAKTKYEISKVLVSEFTELDSKLPTKRTAWDAEDRRMAIFDALSLAESWYYLNE